MNEDYWIHKITRNVERDQQNIEALKKLNWNVYVVWKCELKKKTFAETMQRLENDITRSMNDNE